ncbi:MAG: MFS transporter [Actinomycetota bacterium]
MAPPSSSRSRSGSADPEVAQGRWHALGQLAVALVLALTTWLSASAVIPQLRERWDLSDGAAAWLTIAVQLGFVTGAVLSSVLNVADIFSARRVILAGAAGAALANAFLGVAGGPEVALPCRFVTGFFLAGVYPPAVKLMSTWFRKGRGIAIGVLVGAVTVGSATPHLVNGLGGLDWRTVVYVTSALTLLGGITAHAVAEGPFSFPAAKFDPSQARRVFANRGVRLASLGYFGHMWELYAMWAWFIVFFGDYLRAKGLGGSATPAYATFAVIGIGGLGCWAGGFIGEHWGRTSTSAALMFTSAACALTIGLLFDAPPWLVLVVACIWGFTVVVDSPLFSTMVTELADQAYVGTAVTLQLALGFTLTVATIWLIPVLEAAVGWRWTFAVLAPGPALGALAILRLRASPDAARIAGGRG